MSPILDVEQLREEDIKFIFITPALVDKSRAIPMDAEKPKDARIKSGKYVKSRKCDLLRQIAFGTSKVGSE